MNSFEEYFYGNNVKVSLVNATQVLKTAANGSKNLPKETYQHALFMVANEDKDIFAPIIQLNKQYIIQTRVNNSLASRKLYDFATIYLEITGGIEESEDEDVDPEDYISDLILKSILNPHSTDIDWDWLQEDDIKEAFDDPRFIDTLIDYRRRAQSVTNWPVKELDIHDGNVGFLGKKLYIFDF